MMPDPTFRKSRRVAVALSCVALPLALSIFSSAACAVANDSNGLDPNGGRVVIPTTDSGNEAPLVDADSPETKLPDVPCAASALCRVPTPLEVGSVASLAGRSKNDVWASASRGVVMRWDGTQWTALGSQSEETLTSLFLTAEETWGVAGTLLVRRGVEASSVRTFRLWPGLPGMSGVAVFSSGATYVSLLSPLRAPDPLALLQITDFDNMGMGLVPSPVLEASDQPHAVATRALFMVPDRALWLVGERASVVRYPVSPEIGRGVVMPVPSRADLFAAWGQGDHLWAAGSGGTILHFDGASWSIEDSGTDVTLNALFGFAPNDIWAAGEEGTVLHFDGQHWSQIEIPGYRGQFKAIWGAASDDVWLGGERAMFHWGALP